MNLNPLIEQYLDQGCMRCPLGATPECKVHAWVDVFRALRAIVLGCGLTEEIKWKVPCYTFEGKNVLILAAFKDYCGLNVFKGELIDDPSGILERPGPNSYSAKVGRFQSVDQVTHHAEAIKVIVLQAIEIERKGVRVPPREAGADELPIELTEAFAEDPALESAFFALTPGRQRSHLIFISGAKQSATRHSRVAKCTPRIMQGFGWHELMKS